MNISGILETVPNVEGIEQDFKMLELLEKAGAENAKKAFLASGFKSFGNQEISNFLITNQLSIMRTVSGLDIFKDGDLLREEQRFTAFVENDKCIKLCTGHSINVDIVWVETLLSEYNGVPPANILEALIESKNKITFDYYTIATLDISYANGAVDDPLLLGRINNSNKRYFIAQWDNDIDINKIVSYPQTK